LRCADYLHLAFHSSRIVIDVLSKKKSGQGGGKEQKDQVSHGYHHFGQRKHKSRSWWHHSQSMHDEAIAASFGKLVVLDENQNMGGW
jgi:hypothetical protein